MARMRQFKKTTAITNRDSHVFDKYLSDIDKYPRITPDEEVALVTKMKRGGKEGEKAKNRLIEANLRFVITVAKQYKTSASSLEDLVSEGNRGLVRAAELFDETRGFKFISYAVWWIRQAINQYLAETSSLIRVPLNMHGLVHKYREASSEASQERGFSLSIDEFAEKEGISSATRSALVGSMAQIVSGDITMSENSAESVMDFVQGDNKTDKGVIHASLKTDLHIVAKGVLDKREYYILCSCYGLSGEPMTLDECATHLGITRERTRQLKEKALKKIRRSATSSRLREYL